MIIIIVTTIVYYGSYYHSLINNKNTNNWILQLLPNYKYNMIIQKYVLTAIGYNFQ